MTPAVHAALVAFAAFITFAGLVAFLIAFMEVVGIPDAHDDPDYW